MKRILAISLLGAMLTACGGSGDTGLLPSTYRGSWTGTWSSSDANDRGNIAFTVANDGSVSGTITDKLGASGTLGGFINKSGSLTAVGSFTAGANMVIGGTVTTSGSRLVGSYSYTRLGVTYGAGFDVSPASSGGGGG